MRQIFHTFLLSIRLISSTTFNSAIALQHLSVFDRSLLNAAFGYVYVDAGVVAPTKSPALPLFPVSVSG